MGAWTTTFQLMWSAIGVIAFVAVLLVIREPRMLQRYTYTLGAIGLVLLALPALLPSSISEVPGTGAKIQIALGGLSIQPAGVAQTSLPVLFAGHPGGKPGARALGRAPTLR